MTDTSKDIVRLWCRQSPRGTYQLLFFFFYPFDFPHFTFIYSKVLSYLSSVVVDSVFKVSLGLDPSVTCICTVYLHQGSILLCELGITVCMCEFAMFYYCVSGNPREKKTKTLNFH